MRKKKKKKKLTMPDHIKIKKAIKINTSPLYKMIY